MRHEDKSQDGMITRRPVSWTACSRDHKQFRLKSFSIQGNPLLYFFATDWPHCSKKFRCGRSVSRKEVELSDESFLCNAKPKAAQQAAVCKNSLRTRSNLPTSGSCLRPQGRTSARISTGSCRIVRQSAEPAQWGNPLRHFSL